MINTINRDEVLELIRSSEEVNIIEALPEKYFNEAHLPAAVRIDHTEIMEKAPEMLRDKTAKIVVYCASRECENSSKAARILEQLGYENILVYKEGKEDWISARLSIESGTN